MNAPRGDESAARDETCERGERPRAHEHSTTNDTRPYCTTRTRPPPARSPETEGGPGALTGEVGNQRVVAGDSNNVYEFLRKCPRGWGGGLKTTHKHLINNSTLSLQVLFFPAFFLSFPSSQRFETAGEGEVRARHAHYSSPPRLSRPPGTFARINHTTHTPLCFLGAPLCATNAWCYVCRREEIISSPPHAAVSCRRRQREET